MIHLLVCVVLAIIFMIGITAFAIVLVSFAEWENPFKVARVVLDNNHTFYRAAVVVIVVFTLLFCFNSSINIS